MKKTIIIFAILISFMAFSGCSFLEDILNMSDNTDQNNTDDTGGTDIINTNVDGKIDAIFFFFAQTHVQQPDHKYYTLVGNRETLLKANIISSRNVRSSQVTAVL